MKGLKQREPSREETATVQPECGISARHAQPIIKDTIISLSLKTKRGCTSGGLYVPCAYSHAR